MRAAAFPLLAALAAEAVSRPSRFNQTGPGVRSYAGRSTFAPSNRNQPSKAERCLRRGAGTAKAVLVRDHKLKMAAKRTARGQA